MLSPAYLERCTDSLTDLCAQFDEAVVRSVARGIAKAGGGTADERQRIAGTLCSEAEKEAGVFAGAAQQRVRALFLDADKAASAADSRIYEAAGLAPAPDAANRELEAGLHRTAAHVQSLVQTAVGQAQQAYLRAAEQAAMQVEPGAADPAAAVRNAVRQAAQEGAWVQYPSGHRERVESAVRRAALTGMGQTVSRIAMARARERGCDIMELTAHAGARPSHAVWQGKRVSLSGKAGYLTTGDIGYGTGEGFKGWNCRHDWFPYLEGAPESVYPRRRIAEAEEAAVAYAGEAMPVYRAKRTQRALERKVREARRILAGAQAGLEAARDPAVRAALREEADAAAALLQRREVALRDFLRQTGLRAVGGAEPGAAEEAAREQMRRRTLALDEESRNALTLYRKTTPGHLGALSTGEIIDETNLDQFYNRILESKGYLSTSFQDFDYYGAPIGVANSQIALSIASKVDNDAMEALQGASLIYDGSAAQISYDQIVDAIDLFGEEVNTGKVMFIHPKQVTQLRKDPDFVSADKYPGEVIVSGEIGMIANCRIVPSRKVPLNPAVSARYVRCNDADTGAKQVVADSATPTSAQVKLSAVVGDIPTAAVGDYVRQLSAIGEGTCYACPIVKLEQDDETEDETPAMTVYLKRDTNVETERIQRRRITEITADKIYMVVLSNEAKVVLAMLKK